MVAVSENPKSKGHLAVAVACLIASGCAQDNVAAMPYSYLNAGTGGVAAGSAGVVGSAGVGGAGAGGTAGAAGSMSTAGVGGTAGAGASGAGDGGAGGSIAPTDACDLSGRWLATAHLVTEAIMQKQTTHIYIYYEIASDGAGGFQIAKGLLCGTDAASEGAFAVQVDFKPAWDMVRSKVSFAGRTVTSTPGATGCDVHFAKWYHVQGATLPYYLDPNNPMPTNVQQASGGTPGWEDWDADGNPGITGTLTGTVNGRVFAAPRKWDEPQGNVADVKMKFRLPVMWDQEPNVMSYDPPTNFTLGSPSSRSGDPTLHFMEFSRLASDQAIGDDAAICASVVQLSPTLNPAASAI